MRRAKEARLWQVIGLPMGILGGLLLAYTYGRYGMASLNHTALEYEIASSFIIMAGTAVVLAGRVLHVEHTHLTKKESMLWQILATVCIVGGGVIVVFAKVAPFNNIIDKLATGVAGASFLLIGVMCLMGQRVMSHMHDAWVLSAEEREKLEMEERVRAQKALAFFGGEKP
jgi:hypothetical protein